MIEILGIRRIHSTHGPHVTDIYTLSIIGLRDDADVILVLVREPSFSR